MEVLSAWTWVVGAALVLLLLGASRTFPKLLQRQQATKLPVQGDWGLPIFGEYFQLLKQGGRDFLYQHYIKYGEVFTITVFGRKVIVLNSPEAAKFVLSTAHASFVHGYTMRSTELTGGGRFWGPGHPHFRKVVLAATTGEKLHNVLPFISSLAKRTVESWESMGVVNSCDEIRKYTFTVIMHILWRDVEAFSPEMDQLMEGMAVAENGMLSLPVNLPGFAYFKARKAKDLILKRLMLAIAKWRKDGPTTTHGDILHCLLSLEDFKASDRDVCGVMMNLLFAGYATTAALIPWVMKLLHDNPDVQQRVQDEHETIRAQMVEDESLKWFKFRASLPFTSQVIDETLRLQSIISMVPRRPKADIEFKGLVLPKDATVWTSTTAIHLNPNLYPNPFKFDPSRFEDPPKPDTFMPFGNGPYLCAGIQLAKAETLLLIHHLVTNYRWERVGPERGKPQFFPTPKPAEGFPIRVHRITTP